MQDDQSPLANLSADTPSILNKIIVQRQLRLNELRQNLNENESNKKGDIHRSNRSLVSALKNSRTGFILECKKSSPSAGLLSSHYQPEKIAKQYQPFASAISVLTEPDFFSGSLEHLTAVRQVVSQPVLCKDFIIETSQIYSARAAGADVILLMLSVISDRFWLDCYEIASDLGLDIITEVNNQEEVARAIALPTTIIGINNRNLHDLTTDLKVTEDLVKFIPSDRLIISESGISSHGQLQRLAPLVDGFLIGSSLMQSDNISIALRKLIFGEIKICGLTRRQDADLAWELGATFGGIILTRRSSRCLTLEQAQLISDQQPLPLVGVFLDQPLDYIVKAAQLLNLKAVQLHGNETIEEITLLKTSLSKQCEVWKVISCSEVLEQYPSIKEALLIKNKWLEQGVVRVLIDTPKDTIDHRLNYDVLLDDPQVMIAGSMSSHRITQLQNNAQIQCNAGFDICSDLEVSPGIKDAKKLRQLFSQLQPSTR